MENKTYQKLRNVWRRNVKKSKSFGKVVPIKKIISKAQQKAIDLAMKSFELPVNFKEEQQLKVLINKARRANMKINQNKHPDSFYNDCFVNSEEYKNRYK